MLYAIRMSLKHAIRKLQQQIDSIIPRLENWKLSMNTTKIVAVRFGEDLKNKNKMGKIDIDGQKYTGAL